MNYSKASVLGHAEQLAIVQYSDEHGVKAAADHYAVSQNRVYDLRLDRHKLEAATSMSSHDPFGLANRT